MPSHKGSAGIVYCSSSPVLCNNLLVMISAHKPHFLVGHNNNKA